MGPGLSRMLELIESNPSDTMLVDRYLVLASDIPEHERADATLRLSKLLLGTNPRRSIEISWMIYKAGHREWDCLALIADALERLGKKSKSDALRAEMRRIQSDRVPEDEKKLARITIEEHVVTTLSGFTTDRPMQFTDSTRTNLVSFADFNLDTPPEVDPEASERGVHIPKIYIEPSQFLEKTEMIPPSEQQPVAQMAQKISAEEPKYQASQKLDGDAPRISISDDGAGIPEAIPAKSPSNIAQLILNKSASAPASSVQTVYSRVKSEGKGSEDYQNKADAIRGDSTSNRKAQFIDLIAAEDWEQFLQLLAQEASIVRESFLLEIFEHYKLAKIDIRFASWWIDLLVDGGQERRALRYILQMLAEQPHLAWARMVWPKVRIIRESLNLTPIEWRESDGVALLSAKISALKPKMGCYWIFSSIAS